MLGRRPADEGGERGEGTQRPLLATGSEAEGPGRAQALGKARPAVPRTHPFLIAPTVPN